MSLPFLPGQVFDRKVILYLKICFVLTKMNKSRPVWLGNFELFIYKTYHFYKLLTILNSILKFSLENQSSINPSCLTTKMMYVLSLVEPKVG